MEKKLKKLINKIRANSNRRMLIGLFIIIIGYIFFFNSKFIFNEQEKLKNTPVNTQLELEDRIITLAKWDYAPSENMMEIEFDIVNKSYDGNDSYIFDVADNALHNYSYSVMLTSPTMSVIRVYDVPEDFVCMRVAVNINTGNSTGPVKYYADASLINKVDVIEDYEDFNEYYVNKLNRYIADYEVQKQETQKNIDDNNSSIDNLESLINSLEMQKKYTTADELKKLNTQIADVNKQLISLNNDNKELQEEIDEINKKIDDYKAIKMMYE